MADRPRDLPVEPDGPYHGAFGAEDLLGRLDRWVAAARSDEAAASRARQRWLRQVADESASFAGVLVDLAERGEPVVVHGLGGRRYRALVTGVGTDFVALHTTTGTEVIVAFRGVAMVRADSGAAATLGDRDVHLTMGLPEALAALAADRPRVIVVTLADTDGLAGELRSVGRDVLTLRLDGRGSPLAYLPIAAVAEVRVA